MHRWIDALVLVGLPALGLVHPNSGLWYSSLAAMFALALLATSVLGLAWMVTRWAGVDA